MKKILKSMLAVMIAAFTLASCSDVPSPYGIFFNESGELEGAEGSGTLDDPYNVPAIINLVKKLGSDISTDEPVYIKGYVSQLVEGQNYDAGYGNGTFYISLDGTGKNQFYVYRALYLENKSYTAGPVANIGDEVIICGKVVLHSGNTPETVEKEAYLYSINGETSYDMPEFGTKDNPLSVADALVIIDNLENNETAGNAYVKGKISKVDAFSAGKITYYISDDGQSSKTIQCYKGLGLNKDKFAAQSDLAAGDEVVVYGPLTKYVNSSGYVTPELNDGNYLISLNKGSGPDVPTETIGTKDNPKTVAEALQLINALPDGGKSELKAFVKGKVVVVTTNQANFEKYGNLVYKISADGSDNNTITVYSGDGLNGDKFKSITDLGAGDEVIVFGTLYKYAKNGSITPEIDSGNYLVYLKKADGTVIDGGGSGGSGTPSGGGGEISGNKITVTVATDLNVSNSTLVEEQTLVDGTKLTFAQNGNNNGPKYFDSGKDLRMYPKNSMTITASKKISNVVLTCTNGSVAEGMVSPTATTDGATTLTFSNINATSITITNNHTGTGAASQIRVKSFVITYAQ